MIEYKTVDTRNLEGLEQAEKLKEEGWTPEIVGFTKLQFSRKKPAPKPFTAKMYADLILLAYNAGLENAYEQYSPRWARICYETDAAFIRRAAEDDFKLNHKAKNCIYQDLIDQATTNEWGDGITLTRFDAVHVLQSGLPTGFDVMCKEYGDDEDWVGLAEDEWELIQDEEEYKTFVLSCNDLESYT